MRTETISKVNEDILCRCVCERGGWRVKMLEKTYKNKRQNFEKNF